MWFFPAAAEVEYAERALAAWTQDGCFHWGPAMIAAGANFCDCARPELVRSTACKLRRDAIVWLLNTEGRGMAARMELRQLSRDSKLRLKFRIRMRRRLVLLLEVFRGSCGR